MSDIDGVKSVFRKYDLDGDGTIDKKEFAQVLVELDGQVWTLGRAGVLMSRMDQNSDGKIQLEEFVDWIFKEPTDAETRAIERLLRRDLKTSVKTSAEELCKPFRISSLGTASGNRIVLEPAVDADDSFESLKRRVALALGVGFLQISIVCGDLLLESKGAVRDALPACWPDNLSVVVSDASVYTSIVSEAQKSDGHIELCRVEFPKPAGININMMPFIMGQQDSIPEDFQHYWPLIVACKLPEEELGKIGYLTIHESNVATGSSQRRPGLHVETPGIVMKKGRVLTAAANWGFGKAGFSMGPHPLHGRLSPEEEDEEARKGLDPLDWPTEEEGLAELPELWSAKFWQGGIYMASTVDNSCRAWNMRFDRPSDVAARFGDLEHVRELLGDGDMMEANRLYWMTDATPHESIPLEAPTGRQYFRLVTSSVSVWYAQHSSPNPLGINPDPNVTEVILGDKFKDMAEQARLVPVEDPGKRDQLIDAAREMGGCCLDERDYLSERLNKFGICWPGEYEDVEYEDEQEEDEEAEDEEEEDDDEAGG